MSEPSQLEGYTGKPASSPPCDANEDLPTTRSLVESFKLIPLPVKRLVYERLTVGEKKYGVPLRSPWDKALEYLREEEGDMVAYLVAGGYTWWAVLYSWMIFCRMVWHEDPKSPLNEGLE